jgi:heme-degrading monooxygenase HmoA
VGEEDEGVSVVSVLRVPVREGAGGRLVEAFSRLEIFAHARTSRGFGGARLLSPVAPGEPYLVVADWDDAAAYQGWLDNPVRAELARQLEPLIDGPLEGGVYEEVLSG